MPFVIDGYNLLHAMGRLGGPVGPNQLAKARAGLLGLVAPVHGADPATIVFDARRPPAEVSTDEVQAGVRIEFATGEEADDRIEWLIAHDSAPKRLIVVSDDRRIRQAARRRGCAPWQCDEYLKWVAKKRRQQRARPATEKPSGMGPLETERWLAEFGDLDRDPEWDDLFGPFDAKS
jgi:predicted RNA-binding protein with PIN domain